MRILRVHFKNLNSLAGEWVIDLTHPAFAADGIFAITGPTGAGKSTILDAICLALYARTPRLGKISKAENEIMSRHTGECFTEVTFETQAGRFLCHWSQRRAHRRASGELQAPRHEIAHADSKKIITTKIRGVAEQIETVTGMDYERFTRAVLLAQGGFAAFLQAAPDERAPILEQITGTDIYSQISIRVHERRARERKQLETLQTELSGLLLLNPEEEGLLIEELAQKQLQDERLTAGLLHKQQAALWLEGMAKLQEELLELDQNKKKLQLRQTAFAPDQQRLLLANLALELAAGHAALQAARETQKAEQQELNACRDLLPSCHEELQQAEEVKLAASQKYAAGKLERQKSLPVLRRIRELDLSIAGKNDLLRTAEESIKELSASLEKLRLKQRDDLENLNGKRGEIEELNALLASSAADGMLVEQLTGLQGRFETLGRLQRQLETAGEEKTQLEARLQEDWRLLRERATAYENEKHVLAGILEARTEKQSAMSQILAGHEPAEWRKKQQILAGRREQLYTLLEAVHNLSKAEQAETARERRKTELNQEEAVLQKNISSGNKEQTELEQEVAQLEERLILFKGIEDMEEIRGRLQDGLPCPLCGSREHPFAAGNIPAPDETRKRLGEARAMLKTRAENISNFKIRLAQMAQERELTVRDELEQTEKITDSSRTLDNLLPDFGLDVTMPATLLLEKLEMIQENNSQQFAAAAGILESADALEINLAAIREKLEKSKEAAARREYMLQDAVHKKNNTEQALARTNREKADNQAQLDQELAVLRKSLALFEVADFSISSLEEISMELTIRRDGWISKNSRKTAVEQNIAVIIARMEHQTDQLLQAENELGKQRKIWTVLLREQEIFRRERNELFGGKDADAEETRLAGEMDAAEQALETAKERTFGAVQKLGRLKNRIETLEKTTGVREIQLKSAQDAFGEQLRASGFNDEEHYRDACLPEEKRKRLTAQAQRLAEEATEIASREREKNALLETERQKKITDDALEDIKNTQNALTEAQKELQREIGGLRQKLKDNADLRSRRQEQAQILENHKKECRRWDLLHELIGSADGKKYRNFAQGLTFEKVIRHANRELRKMSDRYLLVRDSSQPLELNVLDSYQAGELRPTKNLSGGECFIVSLALALGLSGMSSQKVRVDSLFLDEGLGSLDEEALETALETMAGLRRDGKLIGVISHIPALKEHIGIQIQVSPQSGGRSQINGPGCRQINP